MRLYGNGPNSASPAAGQGCGFRTQFQALQQNGGLGGGYHRNIFSNCSRGGSYHDYWWEVEHLGRRNYLYNVGTGPLMVFESGSTYAGGDPGPAIQFGDGKIIPGPGSIVTVRLNTQNVDPGYVPGLAMHLTRTSPGTVITADGVIDFCGMDPVTQKYVFGVILLSNPGFQVDDNVRADLWFQQSLLLFEDNVVELEFEAEGGVGIGPAGVAFRGPFWPYAPANKPPLMTHPTVGLNDGAKFPWLLRNAIVRDNYIRKVGGLLDPGGGLSQAMSINSGRYVIVEGNIFPFMNSGGTFLPEPQILNYSDAERVKSFNNTRPTGRLWQLLNDPNWKNNTNYFTDEIETLADDVIWARSKEKGLFS